MVEFGAGGHISDPAALAEAGTDTANANAADAARADGASPTPAAPTTPPATRRKRRGKGWFCPVCRQPYTSLLRITPGLPPENEEEEEDKEADITEGDTTAVNLPDSPPATSASEGRNGLLGSVLRNLNFSRTPPGDVESQTGEPTRVGA